VLLFASPWLEAQPLFLPSVAAISRHNWGWQASWALLRRLREHCSCKNALICSLTHASHSLQHHAKTAAATFTAEPGIAMVQLPSAAHHVADHTSPAEQTVNFHFDDPVIPVVAWSGPPSSATGRSNSPSHSRAATPSSQLALVAAASVDSSASAPLPALHPRHDAIALPIP
jgi:hypothetical protein